MLKHSTLHLCLGSGHTYISKHMYVHTYITICIFIQLFAWYHCIHKVYHGRNLRGQMSSRPYLFLSSQHSGMKWYVTRQRMAFLNSLIYFMVIINVRLIIYALYIYYILYLYIKCYSLIVNTRNSLSEIFIFVNCL